MIYYIKIPCQKSLLSKHALLLMRDLSTKHTDRPSSLTSCSELHARMQEEKWHENFRILDARWDLDDRDYRQMHMDNRIPCSKFFSFEECRDVTSPFHRMLPTAKEFSKYVSKLGVSDNHHVVVYDDHEAYGLYSAPRVWWMFRIFGHQKVSVLDGGFRKWILDGYPTISGKYTKDEELTGPSKGFHGNFHPRLVKEFEIIRKNISSSEPFQVTDARGGGRYAKAHIKNSLSVPFVKLLNDDRTLRNPEEIIEIFTKKGVDVNKDLTASCGSGVTASVLAYALYYAMGKEVSVYDGSFSEFKVRAPHLIARTDDEI